MVRRGLSAVTVLVADYDEAIRHYIDVLGFDLVEDSDLGGGKRWVRVRFGEGPDFLLARATDGAQRAAIGAQTGGRVSFFLQTDDFARDHAAMLARGADFREAPRHEAYGTVAVFADLHGNLFDLIEPRR